MGSLIIFFLIAAAWVIFGGLAGLDRKRRTPPARTFSASRSDRSPQAYGRPVERREALAENRKTAAETRETPVENLETLDENLEALENLPLPEEGKPALMEDEEAQPFPSHRPNDLRTTKREDNQINKKGDAVALTPRNIAAALLLAECLDPPRARRPHPAARLSRARRG